MEKKLFWCGFLLVVIAFGINEARSGTPESPARFRIRQDAKVGYIEASGTIVIPCQFEDGADFREGLAAVKINGQWGFADETGKVVIEPKFGEVFSASGFGFSGGLAPVKLNGKTGFYR